MKLNPASHISKLSPCPACVAAVFLFGALPCHVHGIDNDGDGIPEDWEIFRGTSDADPSDALVDFDGDGYTNYMEYWSQGRPWGNYVLHRFPWESLPPSVPPAGVTWAEFFGANRSGEYLVNCYDPAGPHTFLWTPVPGAPLAATEITEIPLALGSGVMWNDHGHVFLPGSTLGTGEIRSLRQWAAPPVPINWYAAYGQTAYALSNDGRLLLRWDTWDSYYLYYNYQWSNGLESSDTLTIGHNPYATSFNSNYVVDPASGMWLLGAFVDYYYGYPPETQAWHLGTQGGSVSLGYGLPGSLYGAGLYATAGGKAAGIAYDTYSGEGATVYFDGGGWQTISGGAAGSFSVPYGLSDSGIVLGWNGYQPPYAFYLWKDMVVELAKARPETVGGIEPVGFTGSGALYGIDHGPTPRQPVVFVPLANVAGDGAADEPGTDGDADGDGIPDVRESILGTSAGLADTDGDGVADFFELLWNRLPATAEPPSSGLAGGLRVFAPKRHPLVPGASGQLP